MKTTLRPLLALLGLIATATPAAANGILLGGGYLENPDTPYGFLQLRLTAYEDAVVAHNFFGELLIHTDDADLNFIGPRGRVLFTEDGDLIFTNFTANYEFEAKIAPTLSFYAGGGVGFESISINDRFNESLDDDFNGVGQIFLGLRAEFVPGFTVSFGGRHIFREDFQLLGDQFIAEDTWGVDLSIGFRF